eukprot:scaffold29126_cov67-Cyclotella_meneghiniana.AAC.5
MTAKDRSKTLPALPLDRSEPDRDSQTDQTTSDDLFQWASFYFWDIIKQCDDLIEKGHQSQFQLLLLSSSSPPPGLGHHNFVDYTRDKSTQAKPDRHPLPY